MAKKFQFRLERVLNLRIQVEEIRVRELAVAKEYLFKVERELTEHGEKQKVFLEDYGALEKNGSFTAEQAITYCDYKEVLTEQEKDYRKRQDDWMLEVEKCRREAVKVSRERQLLENFKEKKKLAHTHEVQIEEQKFLDEVSSIAFVRRERAKRLVSVS
jgi:flagellar FliJ protein